MTVRGGLIKRIIAEKEGNGIHDGWKGLHDGEAGLIKRINTEKEGNGIHDGE
jgi:hypothetical protein